MDSLTEIQNQSYVKLGEIVFTNEPEKYNLLGIGTCLGIFIYDLKRKRYALAHTLLPTRRTVEGREYKETRLGTKMPAKYTDEAIDTMVSHLLRDGSSKSDLRAKIVGGGRIYDNSFDIGKENIEMARKKFKELNIPLVGEEVGGKSGRSILKFEKNGEIVIRKQSKIFKI